MSGSRSAIFDTVLGVVASLTGILMLIRPARPARLVLRSIRRRLST